MDTTCLISLLLSSWENGIESRAWIERLLCFLLAVVLFCILICEREKQYLSLWKRVKMHATLIMTKRHTTYLIKPRACCGLVSVAGSFFVIQNKG